MKSDSIPAQHHTQNRKAGFSLVEMIGVLAIIAILAVVIVPKVFSTIASSRVTNAVGSISTMKSAITEFAGKYGTIPVTSTNSRIDDLLITAGIMDSRFTVKIGTQPSYPVVRGAPWTRTGGNWVAANGSSQSAQTRLISLNSTLTTPTAAKGANYILDGVRNLPVNSRVVSAVIVNVSAKEAHELSMRLDGEAFTPAAAGTVDHYGKVTYLAANAGTTTAYVYIAHQ